MTNKTSDRTFGLSVESQNESELSLGSHKLEIAEVDSFSGEKALYTINLEVLQVANDLAKKFTVNETSSSEDDTKNSTTT